MTAIYVDHNAQFSIEIRQKTGEVLDLVSGAVNRVLFTMAGITVDSDVYPSAIDYTTEGASGVINFDLTNLSFPAGSFGARVVIYSPTYSAGLVVADGLPINVDQKISGVDPSSADATTVFTVLASNSAGDGSDRVAYAGTADTVTDALDDSVSHIAATAAHGATGAVVGTTNAQTLTNKTLTTPTIADFTNANHDHSDTANGGTIDDSRFDRLAAIDTRIGGELSNSTVDALNDIVVGTAKWSDSLGTTLLTLTGLTKQIDANWATGTNAGGFPSGLTLTDGTWYHVFIIGKTDGTTDAGFDTSLSASNLLSDATGYTLYRRIGSIYYVSGASGIRKFTQIGNRFAWRLPVLSVAGASPNTSQTAASLAVPGDLTIFSSYTVEGLDSGVGVANVYALFLDKTATDTVPSATVHNWRSDHYAAPTNSTKMTFLTETTDAQINYRFSSAPANLTFDIITLGWIDERGQ